MNSLANQIMKVSRRNRKSPAIGRFGGDAGDVIVKRLTLPGVLLNTVVGTGVIGVGTFNSGECQSAPASEFASFAARYQQYRVRSFKLVGKAMHPTCDAVVSQHSCLYLSDFIGSSAPSTAAQVLSDEGSRQVETCKDFTFSTTWARNPNAKLWAPTSAAIPTANLLNIAQGGDPAVNMTAAAAQPIYICHLEWEVEFRGAQ